MRPRGSRIYPYSNGLLLGTEVDLVLTNENSEPVDAKILFEGSNKTSLGTRQNGGDEGREDEGSNTVKILNGMVRLYSKQSYCRGYATDNIWWMMKAVVVALRKKAQLSYVPVVYGEDFEGLADDMAWTAAGHVKCSIRYDDLYGSDESKTLGKMTYQVDDESHERHKNNMRLTVGLLSLLLDRRESAECRRQQYGPFSGQEFRSTGDFLTYQTPTNWWVYAPMLCHLVLGATRMAYFITLNKIEEEIWEGFEPGDVIHAINDSSYDVGREIWDLANGRLSESGYRDGDNPFWKQRGRLIEFLMEYGLGTIGEGIYKNWRMSRRMNNYEGHFAEFPSWEQGAFGRVFNDKHPKYDKLKPFLEAKTK